MPRDLHNIEKQLVAEQPGFTISLIGILCGLFVGLALRAAIAPARIQNLAERAAKKIDSRFSVKVGNAFLSLADGIFPEVAIVINDLSLESEQSCWLRPSVDIDQIKLPINLWKIFNHEVAISEIIANEVSLSLRSSPSECQSQHSADTKAKVNSNTGELLREIANVESRPEEYIDFVSITKLKVFYLPINFSSFEIRNIEINVHSINPKNLHMKGVLHLAGETLSGDYSSLADLTLDCNELKTQTWTLSINGNWREGRYQLLLKYDAGTQQVKVSTDLNHIPLNQLVPLMKKYQLAQWDINGKQTWISLRSESEGNISSAEKISSTVSNFRLEGDIGEIDIDKMQVKSIQPLQFDPFDIEIKSLQIQELLVFLNRPHPSPMLSSLGTFHGRGSVFSANHFSLVGEHSGLGFIFSTQAGKQIQMISLIGGDLEYASGQWGLSINRMIPNEGVFLGKINLQADKTWQKVQIKTRVDEMGFSPLVQRLLTHGGELGSMSGDLQTNFEKGNFKSINGSMYLTNLLMDGMSIKKIFYELTTNQQQITKVDIRAPEMFMKKNSPILSKLKSFFSLQELPDEILAKNNSVKIETHLLEDFYLNNLVLRLGNGVLAGNGGWNQKSELSGKFSWKGPATFHNYQISGTRDKPILQMLN